MGYDLGSLCSMYVKQYQSKSEGIHPIANAIGQTPTPMKTLFLTCSCCFFYDGGYI